MKPRARTMKPAAQARQSQVISTFGPGALVDLADHSVVIGGVDTWLSDGGLVSEERLLSRLRVEMNLPHLELRAPPAHRDDNGPPTGIRAFIFPQWFVAQVEEQRWGGVARPLVHIGGLRRGRFEHDRKPHPVVPIRFVQGCPNGHVSDIDWKVFVHRGKTDCSFPLWLVERGTTGDMTSQWVRCECGQSRVLGEANLKTGGAAPLGYCGGERPWLGAGAREKCGGPDGKALPNRLLARNASNGWFGQTASVIHIPDGDAALRAAVDRAWDLGLVNVTTLDLLNTLREHVPGIKAALHGCDSALAFAEIQRRKGLLPPLVKGLKELEFETLLASKDEIGNDVPGEDFYARRLPLPDATDGPMALVDRVILVHRLREVQALTGFTRFEPPAFNFEDDLDLGVRTAAIAREIKWLPAVENRGEGVLLVLKKDAVQKWAASPAVTERAMELHGGFEAWKHADPTRVNAKFPGSSFVLLHSLSHLLLTAMSLECGYAASSIRERIYSHPNLGYGILLFTGTPDSEGTLGGLVQAGRNIERHLRHALELGRLCSYDPVCAHHKATSREEDRFLHGAACHGCLLISETSCDHRNVFLDRALVVPTVHESDAAFFADTL